MSRSESAATAPKAPAAAPAPASPIPDIDSEDSNNPLAATAYVGDIFAYYRRVEPIFRTAPDYMKNQVGLTNLQLASTKHVAVSNFRIDSLCSSH